MKILLVEDDENKRANMLDFLRARQPNAVVVTARSVHSAVDAVLEGGIDLILLDMTMPTFDITADETGGRPQAYAGREVLRQMQRHDLTIPTIVVTQFDEFGEGNEHLTLPELDELLMAEHPLTYRGIIHYSAASSKWIWALSSLMESAPKRPE